jgi:lysophospholipase L1-like esterase
MRNTLRTVVLFGVSALLAVVAAEVALRLFAPIRYSMKVEYKPDGFVRQRLVPKRRYRLADGGVCTVNRAGYRGPEFETPKPPGVFRIVALGGSSTFSYQTDDDQIWTRRLEEKLRARFGDSIEVVNAGVPGYSAFESKINYVYRIRDLGPDVVLVYHAWNDMKFFRRIEEGEEFRGPPFHPRPIRDFLRRFQLVWRARSLFYLPEDGLPPREEGWLEVGSAKAAVIPGGGRAHRWERANYEDLALLADSDGVLPVFVSQAGLLTEGNLDDPEVRRRVYTEYQGLDYPEILRQWKAIAAIQREAAERHGGLFVDAYAAVPHTTGNFRDHVHLTPAGNEAVAEAIFTGLVRSPVFTERLVRSGALLGTPHQQFPTGAAQEDQADGGVEEQE